MKKVLVVGMLDSVHLAKWLGNFQGQNLEIRLVASSPSRRVHPQISKLLCEPNFSISTAAKVFAIPSWLLDRAFGGWFLGQFIRHELKTFKPELLHLNETQGAGYAYLSASSKLRSKSFTTLLTLYGSDLYWYQNFQRHQKKLRRLLPILDQLSCECERDQKLATELGFRGIFTPRVPAFGRIELTKNFPSKENRRIIAVKGYQNKWGQALVALRALEECQDILSGYKVVVFSGSWRTLMYARLLRARTEIQIAAHPKGALTNEDVLALFRQSIIYIGLSKSDGISASMIEAMGQGAVPIQSKTSCCDEWIEDGVGGFLVNYDDPTEVVERVRLILGDRKVVIRAQASNFEFLQDKLSEAKAHQGIMQTYGLDSNA